MKYYAIEQDDHVEFYDEKVKLKGRIITKATDLKEDEKPSDWVQRHDGIERCFEKFFGFRIDI
jgi:hypothetical protein